ncbi:sterol desaturase family protein [Egicoccus halophilus]|uniref:C-5 sterol desaturase n=1 Tax=Egicoccus halophilus TaxID=1670830 RepID=A0A8J3ABK1_9ACTN|nr:sterol desaturase family protein [Egicoccus halophilus]GGI04206.1 C-5 sterol desaturase [Egicoccus halophilus]
MGELVRGSLADVVALDLITPAIPVFVALMVLEMYVLHREQQLEDLEERAEQGRLVAGYELRDTLSSLTMGLGSLVVPVLVTSLLGLGGYLLVWNLTPLDLGSGWLAWAVALVGKDLGYYAFHRASHENRFLWAAHVVHHSSQRYNLSTALRQSWTPLTSWVFYVPLVLLGVNPAILVMSGAINLLYQFWIHTEAIGTLPRWVEYVWNTPSHHRVHHGSNPQYLDKNYGGMPIVWDRWFGTFEPEVEPVRYGLTTNIETYNPLRIATHEYAAIWREARADTSWRTRLGRVWHGPGWRPAPAPAVPVER